MSCAQSYGLRHLVETQVVFHLRMDQFLDPSQARRAESASVNLHRTVPYCMTIDQRHGHRLFDGIQKQPPARKASNHLSMNSRNHRTQARLNKLARSTQFYLPICSVRAGHQRRVGNTDLQMRYVHSADPLTHMAIAQSKVPGRVDELFQRATL